jgi:hypothetical protein
MHLGKHRLPKENFEAARHFIRKYARPLDQALCAYLFDHGSQSRVLEELARFQNSDGGFGNALEPDFRLAASSPLATTVAFQYLSLLDPPEDHPLVQGGIQYFLDSYDQQAKTWKSVPLEVNDAPHAPWWHVGEEVVLNENGEQDPYQANPSAEITGYLNRYPSQVPVDFLNAVTRQALTHFEFLEDPIENHILLCYLRLAEYLPAGLRASFEQTLRERAMLAIALDPNEWDSGYVLKPHVFAPTPTSLLAPAMQDQIRMGLLHEMKRQEPDGSWAPTWEWGQYEEAWPQARVEWQGHLTVHLLYNLHAYRMLEIA